jgi:hypothetical protein
MDGRINQRGELIVIKIKSSAEGISDFVRNAGDMLTIDANVVSQNDLSERSSR